VPSYLENNEIFSVHAKNAGFLNAHLDADGVMRRVPAVVLVRDQILPSLTLGMAAVGLGERPVVKWRAPGAFDSLEFPKSGMTIHSMTTEALSLIFTDIG